MVFAYLSLTISPSNGVVGIDTEDVQDVFDLTTKVLDYVSKTWDVVNKIEERTGDEKAPLIWFTKRKERKILTNFGRITNLVKITQKETDDVRTMMLGNLKKLQSLPDAMLNGIQVNELLECVRSIENDFSTMEGLYYNNYYIILAILFI